MNNKITLYELLGKIKDGQAPKKIKLDDEIYEYRDVCIDYIQSKIKNSNYWLFKDYLFGSNGNRLNDEVEILDNEDKEKKIPEKLKSLNNVGNVPNLVEFADKQQLNNHLLKDKLNEVIHYLQYLKSKGDE